MTAGRDPFEELRAALDVEPSAGFVAGIRRRASERAGRARVFRLAVPVLAAAAVLLAVVGRPALWPAAPDGIVETTMGNAEVASFVPPAATGEPAAASSVAPADRTGPRPRQTSATAGARPAAESLLDVVTSQPDVLRRLWEARSGWVVESTTETTTAETSPHVSATESLIPMHVPALIVAPIAVAEILPSTGGRVPLPEPPAPGERATTRSQ